MARKVQSWTVNELAAIVDGTPLGNLEHKITRSVPAGVNGPDAITFATSQKYLEAARSVEIGAILAPHETSVNGVTLILVRDPKRAFGQILDLMKKPLPINHGVHPSAFISPDAQIDSTCQIGPFVVIESGAVIGRNVKIYAGCYVGENCRIEDDSVLYPHVKLLQDVFVGKNCILNAGAVVGADGFSFVWDGSKQQKVTHIGKVVIQDHVEIGANTCIDRATCGETLIATGVKLDNLIQIGHNVALGEHTVIAAQTGVSGSTSIGKRATIGGQVAISDHVEIADDVALGGRTGVTGNIPKSGQYMGLPASPMGQALKSLKLQSQLPDLLKRIRDLEKEVEKLRNG